MDKASQVYKKIKNVPTSHAIDMLSDEWFFRKPPKGIRKEVNIVGRVKSAGVLDTIEDHMVRDVWTKEGKLRPVVRKAIFNTMSKYIPKDSIRQVVILGAITSLQYGHNKEDEMTADIDVNVVLDPPELVKQLWEIRRSYNEKLIPGTRHPLNIYLQTMPKNGEIPGYQDSFFGVYDVLKDDWLVAPPPRSAYRNPKDAYWAELISLKMQGKEFMRRVDAFEKSLADRRKLRSNLRTYDVREDLTLQARIQRDLDELVDFAKQLQEGRDLVYNVGWGVPRAGYLNLLYKYIHGLLPEHYQKVLEEVDEYIHKSKFSDGST